ncbi:long-chain-fatty-acid--CoA ligase ACSBG2-like isoform X3 [Synchiropus splendidus]|uniref:long-chain-fatty-acid--CoA ligase ACSBG2-like isoform X3 n=1 Tax=Synchiropus splendidus TaxID=270530 RepID=UPI00237EE722|nr:long-chain-fatty-acid--CoA ligase ACSBG2-like isoform X3 [Synchiropus splendidus]
MLLHCYTTQTHPLSQATQWRCVTVALDCWTSGSAVADRKSTTTWCVAAAHNNGCKETGCYLDLGDDSRAPVRAKVTSWLHTTAGDDDIQLHPSKRTFNMSVPDTLGSGAITMQEPSHSIQEEHLSPDPETQSAEHGVGNNSEVVEDGDGMTQNRGQVKASELQHPLENQDIHLPEHDVTPAAVADCEGAVKATDPGTQTVLPSRVSLAPADQLWSIKRDQAVRLRMEGSGAASETPITIAQMFQQTVEGFGDHPALGVKKEDQWQMVSWREYYSMCRMAAKSFLKLGLERFRGVGILGFNSPEWFIADIGCILAGGLATGIYTTNSPEACQYVAANCEANILVVENQRQLEKILQVKDQLPHLKAIVQYKGELHQKAPFLYTWDDFMKLGEDYPDEQLNVIIDSLRPNECCTLIYTSGTTGSPKGVMLSHDNWTWTAYVAGKDARLNYSEEVVVSYLPLSHVAAQLNDIWICMRFAGTTYFAEPDALKGSLGTTLKEVRPTSFLAVPRVWEKMQEKMKSVGAKASPLRKRIADWAKSIGLQYNYSVMNGENQVPWGFTLANTLVFKKVRAALGLDRCNLSFSGAAPITKDTLEYFMSLNIPVMEMYGMSESSGPHTISLNNRYHITSCGKVMSGCKVKLDKPDQEGNGEICFWGRNVFMGYLNMADKTEEALDQDGWLHSGDLGRFDSQEFLYITGRIKELIITAGGENIPPVPIEDALKSEVAIISNAMLIGDKLKFLSMLLTLKCVVDENGEPTDDLSPEALDFCQQCGVNASKVSEIVANKEPAIYKAIQEGVERINARATSNAQKVQKWVILDHDFSITGGELGPTMKLRRPVVVKMYQGIIDEMYAAAEKQ